MTRRAPWRSASAPTKGCVAPHTMFWIAIASEKSAAVMPRSRIMCGWNSPQLWRIPIARLSITAAPPRMDQLCARVSWLRFMVQFPVRRQLCHYVAGEGSIIQYLPDSLPWPTPPVRGGLVGYMAPAQNSAACAHDADRAGGAGFWIDGLVCRGREAGR